MFVILEFVPSPFGQVRMASEGVTPLFTVTVKSGDAFSSEKVAALDTATINPLKITIFFNMIFSSVSLPELAWVGLL